MWNFERYWNVMDVWGSWSSSSLVNMTSLLCLTANFPVSCTCVHGFGHSQPGPAQCQWGFLHNWCLGLFTWAGLDLSPVLQRSQEGALNIQVRTGWAAGKMKPLDADVFTAGVSFHSHFNPVWQSWIIYEARSTSYFQEGDWVPVCIFPLKERFPRDLNCRKECKGREQGLGLAAELGGRRYLGCRGAPRSPAGSRRARTRGGRDHCCARTGDTPGCSGGRKTRAGKLQTEQTKLSQLFQRFLITLSSRILCLS